MTKSTHDILKIIGIFFIVLLFIAFIGVGPWLTIMSINTIFLTQIPVTIWTWLSIFWLQISTVGAITGLLNQIKSRL